MVSSVRSTKDLASYLMSCAPCMSCKEAMLNYFVAIATQSMPMLSCVNFALGAAPQCGGVLLLLYGCMRVT
jgi:hypothetical protein